MIDGDFLNAFIHSGTLMSSSKGRILLGWGKRHWMATPSVKTESPFFYFPDFFLKENLPWFQQEHCVEIEIELLIEKLAPLLTKSSSVYQWSNPYRLLFKETFRELQEKFFHNEIAKAVPFIFESAEQGMTANQLVRSLLQVLKYALDHPAYLYGFWDGSQGILGATPELLFQFTKGDKPYLETVACAATSATQGDRLSLMNDPKELHEHQLVVQGITESLSPLGETHIGELKLLKLPRLTHLLTPISVKLNHTPNFEAVVRALHPTPALGAFPRKEGMEWLFAYQKKIDRQRFGAPVGYIHEEAQHSCCYVAIRNAQWNVKKILLGAGCGIVSQSQLDNEWSEINLKIQAIKEMLAL